MAEKRIILNCEELETRSALLCDGRLEEYALERVSDDAIIPGSIYLGRIVRLEPGLEAAFVDIGTEKNAFLHYRDMLPASYDLLDDVKKAGKKVRGREKSSRDGGKKSSLLGAITDKVRSLMGRTDKVKRLKELEETIHSGKITVADIPRLFPKGSELLVQVTKGPIGTKGARITTNITIAGRYLVLLPYSAHIGLSSRIDDSKERSRLRKILSNLKLPEGMGLICRTVGEGRKEVFFKRDLEMLLKLWKRVENAMSNPQAPQLVCPEPSLLERTVRDLLTDEIDEIVVDSKEQYAFLKETLDKFVGADFKTRVTLYKRAESVFERYRVSEQVAALFNRIAPLPSGGYLCIDETEALVAIDINSGKTKNSDSAAMILKTNTEAAEEIARQMRLRNIGGQIVIDFIDMASAKDRDAITNLMHRLAEKDHAKIRILPISKFGLMELTRQREQESVKDAVYDLCPYCGGSGHVKSAVSMSVEIQRELKALLKKAKSKKKSPVRVIMHPSVLARLKNDDKELLAELENTYGQDLQFRADPTIHIEEFRMVDPETNRPI